MKTYWDSGGIAPRILNLGTIKRWVVSFTPAGRTWYLLYGKLGGPQSWSWLIDEDKKNPLPSPAGNQNLVVQHFSVAAFTFHVSIPV